MARTNGPRVAKRKSSTKRKRKDESDDEHESDQSENEQVTVASEQSEDEQSEAEEEPSSPSEDEAFHDDEKDEDFKPPKARTARKKSTKKTTKKKETSTTPRKKKLKTGTSTTKKTKSGESKGKKKGSKKKDDIEEDMVVVNEDKDSMFASVRKESSAIREIVDNWQESFDSGKSKATAELLTFILHSSGVKGDVQFEEENLKASSSRMEKIIDDLIEEFPTSLQVYPIINNHPSLKHFRKNFSDFWDTFVDVTKEGSQLYEKSIQEKFMNWLTLMASSTCRALRHTATLAAYQIATSAIDARKSEAKTLAKLESQAKAAKNKKKEKELLDMCEEYQDKTNTLEKICQDIFSQIFIKRYRDSCPDIRALSLLQAIGWVIGLPEQFLNDNSLKFFGWLLNDSEESVRKVAVQVLDKLYSKKDWKDQLTSFTTQFLPRIISMTRDNSVGVSVESIKLLTTLLQNGYLKTTHIDEITKLMFNEVSSVRFYAAKFAYAHIKSKSEKDSSKSKKSKKSGVSLKDVLEFVSESVEEFSMAPYYVVDSWWSLDSDIFRSYKQICQMINDEEGDALTLIKILNASIQKLKGSLKSVTVSADNVKVNTKSKLTTKEVEEEVEEITGILAPYLSGLIDKYRTEPEIVVELVEIPQHLDMDNYSESHFTKLLKSLKETLNTNISSTVYLQIAKTFKYLIKDHEDYSLRSEATLQYSEIIREMSSQLKDAVQTLHEQDEPTADVLSTLNRIRAFTKVVGTSQLIADEVLFEDMNLILESKISEIEMSQKDESSSSSTEEVDEVTPIIIDIIQDDLFWTLKDSLTEKDEARSKLQKKYLTKQEKITTPLFYVLKKGKIGSSIIMHCYNHLMNTYVVTCAGHVESEALLPLTTNDRVEILRRFFTKSMKHFTKEYILNSTDDEEEEIDEDEKKKRTAKRKVINQTVGDLILGITRAIMLKSLPDSLIPDILSYFVKTKIPIVEDFIKKFHADIKHRFESKLWEYEFGALKTLHTTYLDLVEQEDEKTIIKKALKDLEELGSRISKSHFPGKDVKHLELLVTHTINFIFDDINQYHSFLTGLMKFRFKGIPDAKRSEFVKAINRKLDQNDDVDRKAKETVESFIELLQVKKKKGDETEDEKTDNEKDNEKDKMEDEEEEKKDDEEKEDEEEKKDEEKDKMEDDDNTQISETKEVEEDEELISSKPRSSL